MKSQATIISAFLATTLIVLVVLFYYINVFPYSTTLIVHTRNYDIYSIIYSRVSWTAKGLAYTILNTLDADYVSVNITIINITNMEIVKNDYYSITPQNHTPTIIHAYNISRLDDSGLLYRYYLKVGFK